MQPELKQKVPNKPLFKSMHLKKIKFLIITILLVTSCNETTIDPKLETKNVSTEFKNISITHTSNNQTSQLKLTKQIISRYGNLYDLRLYFEDGSVCFIETKVEMDVNQTFLLTLNNSLGSLPNNYARVEFYDRNNQRTYYSTFQNDGLSTNPEYYNNLYYILNLEDLRLGLFLSSDVVAILNGKIAILK